MSFFGIVVLESKMKDEMKVPENFVLLFATRQCQDHHHNTICNSLNP